MDEQPRVISQELTGGYRKINGTLRKKIKGEPLITVITVCLNRQKDVEKTILSILGQTYNNIEYIIIDGGSHDGTLKVIRKYDKRIAYWMSEKDNGIYDAMNKGIKLASGEWLNFMNAGDVFFSKSTIEKIFQNKKHVAGIVYGDCKINYEAGFSRIQKASDPVDVWKGVVCSHQSLFCKTCLLKNKPFNTKYSLGADYDFFFRNYVKKIKFEQLTFPVSTCSAGGIVDNNLMRGFFDILTIARKYSPGLRTELHYLFLFCKMCILMITKKILPRNFYFVLLKAKWG
jgi:glycosyltransferase involved in cell wall biosynthesis